MFTASSLCSTPYENVIMFHKVHFINYHDMEYLLYIKSDLHNNYSFNTSTIEHDKVIFHDCLFTGSVNITTLIHCEWFHEVKVITQALIIRSCLFTNNTYCKNILDFISNSTTGFISPAINTLYIYVHIGDTNFTSNVCNIDKLKRSTMVNSGGNSVVLQGPIIIHGNSIEGLFALYKGSESTIMFQGYIEFSKNKATYMIESHTIFLMEHVVMNVTRNVISYLFIGYKVHNVNYVIPMCFFSSMKDKRIIQIKVLV